MVNIVRETIPCVLSMTVGSSLDWEFWNPLVAASTVRLGHLDLGWTPTRGRHLGQWLENIPLPVLHRYCPQDRRCALHGEDSSWWRACGRTSYPASPNAHGCARPHVPAAG